MYCNNKSELINNSTYMIKEISNPRYKYKFITWKFEYYSNNLRELLKTQEIYNSLVKDIERFIEDYQSNIFRYSYNLTESDKTKKALLLFNNAVNHLIILNMRHIKKDTDRQRIVLGCFIDLRHIIPPTPAVKKRYKELEKRLYSPLPVLSKHIIKER